MMDNNQFFIRKYIPKHRAIRRMFLQFLYYCFTVESLITVTSAQGPPPDMQSVKKVPTEFKVKLS